MKETRSLDQLVQVGPAALRDLKLLGVRGVQDLARRNPEKLYERLCRVTGKAHDMCCLDVFTAAVAQARNPKLPQAQRDRWYWSRRRKAREKRRGS